MDKPIVPSGDSEESEQRDFSGALVGREEQGDKRLDDGGGGGVVGTSLDGGVLENVPDVDGSLYFGIQISI